MTGRLEFVDSSVDAGSGTVKLKAYFDNSEGRLWPGAFVNVSMAVKTLKDAVVVPQATVIESARGSVVYVVDDAGTVSLREVRLLHADQGLAALSGLNPGDKVVFDGRQNLRPGMSVVDRSQAGNPSASAPAAGKATGQPSAP